MKQNTYEYFYENFSVENNEELLCYINLESQWKNIEEIKIEDLVEKRFSLSKFAIGDPFDILKKKDELILVIIF